MLSPAARVIRTLERIAAPAIRTSSVYFVALALAEWAECKGITLDFIERFNGSYRRGVLDMYILRKLSEVREQTEQWLAG